VGRREGGGSAKGSPKGDAKKGDAPEKAAKGEPAPKGKTAAAPKEMKSAKEGIKPVENYPTNPMKFEAEYPKEFAARVQELEEEGMDNGDAQGVAMAEVMTGEFSGFFKNKAAAKGESKKPPSTEQVDEMFNAFSNDKKIRDKDGVVRKADGSAIETDAEGKEINPAVRNAKQLGKKTNTNRQIPNYNNKATDPEASPEEAQKALQKNQALIGLKKQAKVYGVDDVTMLEMAIRKFGNDPQYAILKEIKEDIDASASLDEQATKPAATPQAPGVAAKKTKTTSGDLLDFYKENKNNQSLTQAIDEFENSAEPGEFNLEKFQEYLDKKGEDPDLSDDQKEFYENAHSQVEDELRTLVGMDRREPKQSDDAEFNANQEKINQRDTNDKAKQELFKQSDNLVDSYKKQGQSVTDAVNSAYEEALAMAGGEDSDLLKTIRGQYSDLLRNKTLRPQDNIRDEISAANTPNKPISPQVSKEQQTDKFYDDTSGNNWDEIEEAAKQKIIKDFSSSTETDFNNFITSYLDGVDENDPAFNDYDSVIAEYLDKNNMREMNSKKSKLSFGDEEATEQVTNNDADVQESESSISTLREIEKLSSTAETGAQKDVLSDFKQGILNGRNYDAVLNDLQSQYEEFRKSPTENKEQLDYIKELKRLYKVESTPAGSDAEQGTDIYDFARENSNNQTISTYVSEFETYANDGEFTLPKFKEYLEMMSQDEDAPRSQREDYAEKAALVEAELEFKQSKTVPVDEVRFAVNYLIGNNPDIKQELNTILSFMRDSAKNRSIETANEWFLKNGGEFIDRYSGDPEDKQKMRRAIEELKKELQIK
jgi:hypothetical protein